MQATPATWQLLLSGGWTGRTTLKALCGGVALPTSLSAKLVERVATLWNVYGPTETTIWSCRYLIAAPDLRASLEPIGHPIENTRIHILDPLLKPVPIGVAGEIYIGGAGVARGYLNRADLTQERFIADPFDSKPGARLYKTGDLGRWRGDGAIEYLGRNDHQVKIRGFRIELGEVEAQLLRHSDVAQGAVIPREDTPGDKRLVAYIRTRSGEDLNAEELRAHMKSGLPDYMVPAAFVMIDAFPLTPSGKLDRRSLPRPDSQAFSARAYEPAQGNIEETLAQIWQELLHLERVGRSDNFFELGGHSLLGMRMIALIEERLDARLSAVAVFQHPTIGEMARAVETLTESESGSLQFEEGVL